VKIDDKSTSSSTSSSSKSSGNISYANTSKINDSSVAKNSSNIFGPQQNILLANKNPNTGEPNSTSDILNPDGTLKQRRWYGPDGLPFLDRDYNHSGKGHEFPHDHAWENGQRQPGVPSQKPQDDKETAKIVIGGVAVAGTGYIVYRVVRMIPSLFPPLWPTIPANALCP
jgi:hypothetical protein